MAFCAAMTLLIAACSSSTPATLALASPTEVAPTAVITPSLAPPPTPIPTAIPTLAPTSPPAILPTATPAASLAVPSNTAVEPSAGVSPSAASGSGSAFALAGLSTIFDQTVAMPALSTFGTSFPADSSIIYVEYALQPELSGSVTGTWMTADGTQLGTNNLDYPAGGPWAWFQAGGYAPGSYDYVLQFAPTQEKLTLPFTLTGPAPSGIPFTVFQMATAADSSQPAPDPSTYTDTFAAGTSTIYADFELRNGLSGTVSCDMTENGTSVLTAPITLDYGGDNTWGDFAITLNSNQAPGTYAMTLTFEPTGETQTVDFTIQAP